MIYRDGPDLFRITTMGTSEEQELTFTALADKLRAISYWTEGQISDLQSMSIGDHTIKPHGYYVPKPTGTR